MEKGFKNTRTSDNGGRLIFENDTLCSQFLREYARVEILKDIQPEDIEDMTERFLPMFTQERDSDVVKRMNLPGEKELFLVALIEHKSSVDYNVVMQMFHYMRSTRRIWRGIRRASQRQRISDILRSCL